MPRSGDKFSTMPHVDGQGLAVVAESLYLTNLLLAPGPAFGVLLWLWFKHGHRPAPGPPALKQTTFVSLWGGILIVVFPSFSSPSGLHWEWTWVPVILLFHLHPLHLVLFGMFGCPKPWRSAWRYP